MTGPQHVSVLSRASELYEWKSNIFTTVRFNAVLCGCGTRNGFFLLQYAFIPSTERVSVGSVGLRNVLVE